jgi:hypothetical protein
MLLLNHIYSLIIGYFGRIIKPPGGAINKIFLYPSPNAIDNINNIKKMINLLITIILICGSLGATIAKTTTHYGVRKQRQHTEPLRIDKEVMS